jgi:hypothetical protein
MIDAIEIYARCALLFEFSRGETPDCKYEEPSSADLTKALFFGVSEPTIEQALTNLLRERYQTYRE